MTETLIEARGLSAGYGKMAVVRDVNIHVDAGEVVALLGANGAGKTTTLLTLAGELTPIAGEVRLRDVVTRAPMHARCRDGLGYLTFAGTVKSERRRGAQSALIAHRVAVAQALGCTRIVSRTLTMLEDSLANLQRGGFREVFEQEVYEYRRE